jgi:hypothetical protein
MRIASFLRTGSLALALGIAVGSAHVAFAADNSTAPQPQAQQSGNTDPSDQQAQLSGRTGLSHLQAPAIGNTGAYDGAESQAAKNAWN